MRGVYSWEGEGSARNSSGRTSEKDEGEPARRGEGPGALNPWGLSLVGLVPGGCARGMSHEFSICGKLQVLRYGHGGKVR